MELSNRRSPRHGAMDMVWERPIMRDAEGSSVP